MITGLLNLKRKLNLRIRVSARQDVTHYNDVFIGNAVPALSLLN